MADNNLIRLATRGSALALWQANRIASLVQAHNPDLKVELVVISTKPDRIQDRPLHELGGDKGLFVKEVELAVVDGRADAAVHSLKDVPVEVETVGLRLAAFPERERPSDVLISRSGSSLEDLPSGSTVATGAPRRQAQLLAIRPDLQVCGVRGNVETRVRKLHDGEFDGLIMAEAGLRRLGMEQHITQVLSPDQFVSAPGQGIVVVQAPDASPWNPVWQAIDNPIVRLQAEAERQFSRRIGATCYTAAGCLLTVEGTEAIFRAVVCSPDGTAVARYNRKGELADIPQMIAEAAEQVGSVAG